VVNAVKAWFVLDRFQDVLAIRHVEVLEVTDSRNQDASFGLP
jgi:hypothetical protein